MNFDCNMIRVVRYSVMNFTCMSFRTRLTGNAMLKPNAKQTTEVRCKMKYKSAKSCTNAKERKTFIHPTEASERKIKEIHGKNSLELTRYTERERKKEKRDKLTV